jgi:hypothetical protein
LDASLGYIVDLVSKSKTKQRERKRERERERNEEYSLEYSLLNKYYWECYISICRRRKLDTIPH